MISRQKQIEKLEKRLKHLEESLGERKEPTVVAQVVYAEVKIHAELERLRLGIEESERKSQVGAMSDEELKKLVKEWLSGKK